MTRLLILVLSHDREPWRTIEHGQGESWAARSSLPAGVDVFWYQGHRSSMDLFLTRATKALRAVFGTRVSDRLLLKVADLATRRRVTRVDGRVLRVGTPDVWRLTAPKLHQALSWALANCEFDYVWRTNSSTFTSVPGLLRVIDSLPPTGVYGGFECSLTGHGALTRFVGGTGILMSRDVVQTVVDSLQLRTTTVDDIAVGWACHQRSITIEPIRRLQVLDLDDIARLSADDLRSAPFVRCKTEGADRSIEVEMMTELERRYGDAGS